MKFLKTNTAVRLAVGPFLDKADGFTPKTALTVTGITCELYKDSDDGNAVVRTALSLTASGGDNDMVHITSDVAGYYDLELTAADVNFLGRMTLVFTDTANILPVFMEFMVLPAMIYDSLVGGTDYLQADVTQIAGSAVDAAAAQLGVNLVNWKGSAAPVMSGDEAIQEAIAGLNDISVGDLLAGDLSDYLSFPVAPWGTCSANSSGPCATAW